MECKDDAEKNSGGRRAKGSCDSNRLVDGPGGCFAPAPVLAPVNEPFWRCFHRAIEYGGGINYRGMDGAPAGIRPEALESCARAAGLPWDDATQERLAIIQGAWKATVDEMMAIERDDDKKTLHEAEHGAAGRAAAAMAKRLKQPVLVED